MKKTKIFTLILLSILLLLVAVIFAKSFLVKSKQISARPAVAIPIDEETVAEHLSQAIKFKTISSQDENNIDYGEFLKFQDYLDKTFPKINSELKKEAVNNYSLLYTWEGSNKDLKPIILLAHMDVVPVDKTEESNWQHPPFSGDVADGYVWGRGARDDKSQLVAILESAEYLLEKGFKPQRTIYFAFGHDEEILGENGAKKIASLLESRNVKPEFILDEGGTIMNNAVTNKTLPEIDQPLAMVCIIGKGYLTVELNAVTSGGHPAYPPKDRAIEKIAQAVEQIEKNDGSQFVPEGTREMLDYLAPEMSFPYRQVFSNLWLFNTLAKRIISDSPSGDSFLGTTGTATMIQGGFKENVLPSSAKAVVNFRIAPGESVESTLSKIRKDVADLNVSVTPVGTTREPSRMADINSHGFLILEKTIKQIFPNTLVAPSLFSATGDFSNYENLTNNIFNFGPAIRERGEASHGDNERIPIGNYKSYIKFYTQLISNFSS